MNSNVILHFIWNINSRKKVVLCISGCVTLKYMRYAA